jgi:hypothetical protein
MIYFLWLFPVIVALILFAIYKNVTIFHVGGVFLAIVMFYTLIHQYIAKDNLVTDTEWWGNYATSVHYYDDWDEEVPCRHPIYCTRTYECNCDSKGENCSTCTEEYICGYEHPYDVDYHPEYWAIRFDNHTEHNITRYQYYYYCSEWGNNLYKVELHRDYHSNDGDDMACDWNHKPETSDYLITQHTYENKVQASNSVFKAEKIDTMEIKQYKLFNYDPSGEKIIYGSVLVDKGTLKLYHHINGYYGSKKQFKLYMCFYRNQSETTAERQHSYWENLNKNEFLVCIGLDNTNHIQWCKTYSWMDKPYLSTEVEHYFINNNTLDLKKFAQWLPSNIEKYWSRKHFRDFNYIQVEITSKQYFTIFIVVLVITIVQIIVTIVLKNESI